MKININTKKEDKVVKMEIGYSDCFNLDGVLGRVIVASLQAFKAAEHASFTVEEEDLPENLRYEEPLMIAGAYTEKFMYGDNIDHLRDERFNYIIDEMIFGFRACYDQSQEDYYIPNPDYDPDQGEIINHDNGSISFNIPIKIDDEKQVIYDARVQRGINLFSKYYRALWI